MPQRIQRSRAAGWRMPPGARYVGRPGLYGNPFPVAGSRAVWTAVALGLRADAAGRRDAAVRLHRAWITGRLPEIVALDDPPKDAIEFEGGHMLSTQAHCRNIALFAAQIKGPLALPPKPTAEQIAALRGVDLACWCDLGGPCHADVLLELANG